MRTLSLILLLAPVIILTGCMTEATQKRFESEGARADNCRSRVTAAKIEIQKYKAQQLQAQPQVQFTNENTALLHGAIKIIGDTQVALIQAAFNQGSDDMASCDDVIVAMVRADSAKVAGLNNNGMTAIKWIAGLVGLGIISDNWGPSNYNGTTGDTWNVSGSRVNSRATATGGSSISSSGTGLGLANTFSDRTSQSVGGFEPRTIPVNGNVTSVEVGSLSGENAPVGLPEVPEVEPVLPIE